MTKKIFLQYDSGVRAVATLLEEHAPRTCEALWGAFETPRTMQALHAMYAGPEVMVGLPEEAQNFDPQTVPFENQQVVPAPGDLMWYWQQPMQMGGLPFEWYEVGVFYDRGARVLGPLGWTPVNIWASVTEGLEEFARESAAIRIDGAKQLTIGRVS
ncbi:DUF3830 family protein [Microbacterium xanthum]|uniref:DUF3830 family protein n=1 Tax=Microbacterium xanthum TaxID=3079794 RepID=UPI002AD231B8|nr:MULTISPECIES: DUF3830 family protein [unclassified Microbacterium]MDZ8170929.1 DUF3830 family protein [Microbacterium sp. KSW-48]MDZ8201446.1 DUF3830 family protein [Microbacterium sp. SSW1-59]